MGGSLIIIPLYIFIMKNIFLILFSILFLTTSAQFTEDFENKTQAQLEAEGWVLFNGSIQPHVNGQNQGSTQWFETDVMNTQLLPGYDLITPPLNLGASWTITFNAGRNQRAGQGDDLEIYLIDNLNQETLLTTVIPSPGNLDPYTISGTQQGQFRIKFRWVQFTLNNGGQGSVGRIDDITSNNTTIQPDCPTLGSGANISIDININPDDTLLIDASYEDIGILSNLGGGDEDIIDNVLFSVSGIDASIFSIAPAIYTQINGEAIFADLIALDSLKVERYDFNLRLTDIGGLFMEVPVVICVDGVPALVQTTNTNNNKTTNTNNNNSNTSQSNAKLYTHAAQTLGILFVDKTPLKNTSYNVYDLYGRLIIAGKTNGKGEFNIPTEMVSGVYITKVFDKGVGKSNKFYYHREIN